MDWRQKRSCLGVRHLLETARENGLAPESCLLDSAIDATHLEQSSYSIEAWQELAVIRNLIQRINRPGLGFATGQRYHLTSLGLLGFTMLASDNLHAALTTLDRFQTLSLAICPVRTLQDTRGLWVTFDDTVLPRDASVFVIERGLAAVMQVVSELMQRQVIPLEIQVRYHYPPAERVDAPKPLKIFSFGCDKNGVLFANADLICPLPQANHVARHQGEISCGRLAEEAELPPAASPTGLRVQRILQDHAASLMSSEQVAVLLGMSERTLLRRLADEEQSFKQLNDQIKTRLAKRLLSESTMNLQEIATRLGYADSASFCRAFQRWTGQTPGRWKRSM